MRVETNNSGENVTFTQRECDQYASICAMLPTNLMKHREADFIRRMEVRFRGVNGAHLTIPQFDWFAAIADRYQSYIGKSSDHADMVRALARGEGL